MILTGELSLSYDKDDYIMFSGGRLANLTEILNTMLLEDVKLVVRSMYDKEIIINASGRLIKNKFQPKYYLYYVGDTPADEILWDLVGRKLEIELINITNN